MIQTLYDMDYFGWMNFFIFVASSALIYVTISHYIFFLRAKKTDLTSRVRDVFFAEFISALSVLGFNATVFLSGNYNAYLEHEYLRVGLKAFQAIAVVYTLYASWRFHQHCRKTQ